MAMDGQHAAELNGKPAAEQLTLAQPQVDQPRIERAVREILLALGEDPERDGLADTPARVARMYAEQFAGLRQRPEEVLTTVFDSEHDEIVLVRDIEVYSMCEHHLVPFFGKAHIGYIPNDKGRDHRPVQARQAGRRLRQATAGAGADDLPDRRRPDADHRAARCHRGA
jgi:hypothetical protein